MGFFFWNRIPQILLPMHANFHVSISRPTWPFMTRNVRNTRSPCALPVREKREKDHKKTFFSIRLKFSGFVGIDTMLIFAKGKKLYHLFWTRNGPDTIW